MKAVIRKTAYAISAVAGLALSLPLNASVLDFWGSEGWTMIANGDSYVGPGGGGQSFDAEYLFYKQTGNTLSIGLQSGFDLSDGAQYYLGKWYYAGDLALSFNGDEDYDFAVDFGLVTRDYNGYDNVGIGSGNQDAAGLYQVTQWNNDLAFTSSSPFGMDEGSLLADITDASSGSETLADGLSYFRTVSFDLTALGFKVDEFSAHWTMSCGNDRIEGSASVPEPGTLLLMAGGLFGLIGGRKFKSRVKA